MKSVRIAVVLALMLVQAAPVLAQSVAMDTVVVTARGRESKLSETPGSIGVVTSEDIAQSPKASIADVLAGIPGVTVTGDSAWGRDVSIRGLSGTSVVILIDGMRINTATDINARLGVINPMDVERVEVLKGPVSSLYGSGSTGGVINIITRKGSFTDEAGVHGRVAQGVTSNPAGYDGYANLRYDSKKFWTFGSVGLRDHDSFYAGGGDEMDNSQYSDVQGRAAAGLKLSERLKVEMQALKLEADDVGIPGGPSTLPATARVTYPRTGHTFASLVLTAEPEMDYLRTLEASVYYDLIERRVRVDQLPAALPVRELKPAADHESMGGKIQGTSEIGDHYMVYGADLWTWDMTSSRRRYLKNGNVLSDKPVPDAKQTSVGVFVEDDWALRHDLTLNLGARLDQLTTDNKAYGRFDGGTDHDLGWNVHAGLVWAMTGEWSQSLLLASSYRAGDLLERFKFIDLGGGQQLFGNPDVDPEQSLFAEYGLQYSSDRLHGEARVFYNRIRDFISTHRVSPTRLEVYNVGDAVIYGAELDGQWRFLDDWILFGSVAGQIGRDESEGEPLSGIAPLSGRFGLEYKRDGWWGRVEARWAAEQNDTPDGVDDSDAYMTGHVAGGYRFAALGLDHDVSLALDNILDSRYRNYLANSRGMTLYEPGFAASLNYVVEF